MSDGDGDGGTFGAAPGVGDVEAALDELAAGGPAVYYELSPREARDGLSSFLQNASVELVPTNKEEREMHDGLGG